jgi:hypothetical protein
MVSRVTKRLEKKIAQILEKVAKTVAKPKMAKHLQQTLLNSQKTFNKPYFETAYYGEKEGNLH